MMRAMNGMKEGEEYASGMEPIKAAIAKVQALLDGVEVGNLRNAGKPKAVKVEIEAEGDGPEEEACAACMDGTCDDPSHLKDDDVEALTSLYAGNGE